MDKKALIVVTNHTNFEHPDTEPTGLWISELTHFYDEFEKAGISMDIVSPQGGKVSVDERSLKRIVLNKAARRRHDDPAFMALLEGTRSISDVNIDDYDVLYFAGGHGAMWDFADSDELHAMIRTMYESDRVVAAVCHGTAALQNVRLSNGEHLIDGKNGTGFAYFDETISGTKKLVPYNLQQRLIDRGMHYSKAKIPLGGHVVVDGRLITGQNPNSTTKLAIATLQAMSRMADDTTNNGLGNRVEGQQLARARALYMEGIAEGRPKEAVDAYTGDRYTQHSTGVKDGREGFIEFFTDFVERNPKRHIEIVRGWEDGRYVFLHAYQSLNDGEHEYVTTDFFDTDDEGKIIEHWDVIGEFKGPNPSGRTQVDGATEITDLDRTEENKAVVKAMLENCLFPGARPDRVEEYFAEDYLQHNPNVGDGLAIVRQLAQGENRQLTYDEIVLLVGRGNFVAVLVKANWEGNPLAQVDILRLEDGKIVEHWDNNEPVPENDVNSGKF